MSGVVNHSAREVRSNRAMAINEFLDICNQEDLQEIKTSLNLHSNTYYNLKKELEQTSGLSSDRL